MNAKLLSVAQTQALLAQGYRLVDIRSVDEFRREHITGAQNIALEQLSQHTLAQQNVVFCCLSGMRTQANSDALAQCTAGEALLLDGGLNAWKRAQGETTIDRSQPLPLMRQVQIVAGLLVFISILLGTLVHSGFLLVAGFVGLGLTFAGLTGWCGMAILLMKMPWNKRSQYSGTSCSL